MSDTYEWAKSLAEEAAQLAHYGPEHRKLAMTNLVLEGYRRGLTEGVELALRERQDQAMIHPKVEHCPDCGLEMHHYGRCGPYG